MPFVEVSEQAIAENIARGKKKAPMGHVERVHRKAVRRLTALTVSAGLAVTGMAWKSDEINRFFGGACKLEQKGYVTEDDDTVGKLVDEAHPKYNPMQRKTAIECITLYNGLPNPDVLPKGEPINRYGVK